MPRLKLAIFFLLPALFLYADATGHDFRGRGSKIGNYSLQLVGTFNGTGAAIVNDGSLSLTAAVTLPDGSAGSLVLNAATLKNDRFTAAGSIMGAACTVDGRVDLPSATDTQTNDNQSYTGRLLATVRDANGRMAKIVGIQDPASRLIPPLPGQGGGGTGGTGGIGGAGPGGAGGLGGSGGSGDGPTGSGSGRGGTCDH